MTQMTSSFRLRCAMTLAILWGAALVAGCGSSNTADEIVTMVHDDTSLVLVYDVAAISAGEAYHEFAEKIEDDWDETVGAIGILMDETETMLIGHTEIDPYIVLKGEFDLEYIRGELEDNEYERDSFRGYEVWSGGGLWNASTVALIEESGIVLRGSDSNVRDILRDLSRGSGPDDVTELMRAVEAAGDGWLLFGVGAEGCPNELRRCEGNATSISRGERFELVVNDVFMFQDERSAELAKDDLEERMEDAEEGVQEIVSLSVDGEFVTLSGRIDEDDFYKSLTIGGDVPGW